jgi:Leucine-rich repeat (LRR) protein
MGERSRARALSLCGAGITSLRAPLPDGTALRNLAAVRALNLHGNRISVLEGLGHLRQLETLDLSSNSIAQIQGLEALGSSLRALNLACNHIERVEGLASLCALTHLNLSFNAIRTLQGFAPLAAGSSLVELDLRGNRIADLAEIRHLAGLRHLRSLLLWTEAGANPVCALPAYHKVVFELCPQLQAVDGRDREGQPSSLRIPPPGVCVFV